jgi:23S rRNA (guanosine2251-2'-O)-methyltransferase
VALIVGSEEDGISPELLKAADQLVKIPMFGHIASLNVSVAAAISMYEVVRQRQAQR